ncbi:AAA family ATPase [Candidatus Poribacteria bacterium]|nr:AAA family ATPase [Candidatus Poribacteria bacterium]
MFEDFDNTLFLIISSLLGSFFVGLVTYFFLYALKKKQSDAKKAGENSSSQKPLLSLANLPSTEARLFGRDNELKILDSAWNDPEINIVSLVAAGGVGKTTLVNNWLNKMQEDDYRGAARIYGWSFYNQGVTKGTQALADKNQTEIEETQASADAFITAALEWFGDPNPTEGSLWNRGERLAGLIGKQKTLLILDGLEPLQNPPGQETGKIKDRALKNLLRGLMYQNSGLCIITTRLPVDDLKENVGNSVKQIVLEDLSHEAGAKLLKSLGVKDTLDINDTDDEINEAMDEFGRNALTLTLLGRYLAIVYGGDIRERHRIDKLTIEPKQGEQAKRIMKSYETWFKDETELGILKVMGLFYRPEEIDVVNELLESGISMLIPELKNKSDVTRQIALSNLRDAGLLFPKDPNRPDILDWHPLMREYFGEKLKEDEQDSWRKAHYIMYKYYESKAKEFPETFKEMESLYTAMAHGCQAERYEDAWNDVYLPRIPGEQRPDGKKFYSTYILGAFGAELDALSHFFSNPWKELVENIDPAIGLSVRQQTGFCLRAQGLTKQAVDCLKEALKEHRKKPEWKEEAVKDTSILMQLYLNMGEIENAEKCIGEGVDLADEIEDVLEPFKKRTEHAWVLFKMGRMVEADKLFNEAWSLSGAKQAEKQQGGTYSYSVSRYCEFLLSMGRCKCEEAEEYTNKAEKVQGDNKLAIALNTLTLGKIALLKNEDAEELLNNAAEGFRESGRDDDLPRGLLARALYYIKKSDFTNAQRYLDEVMTFARDNKMRLYEADCYLEYSWLYLTMDKISEVQKSMEKAREMINHMCYHRWDREVKFLEEVLKELRNSDEN